MNFNDSLLLSWFFSWVYIVQSCVILQAQVADTSRHGVCYAAHADSSVGQTLEINPVTRVGGEATNYDME